MLAEDANVYKLVGPVLLKQERSEAVMAVTSRLEFIDKEMFALSLLFTILPTFSFVNYAPRMLSSSRTASIKLTFDSKRIEKQIAETQEKAEKKKIEVRIFPVFLTTGSDVLPCARRSFSFRRSCSRGNRLPERLESPIWGCTGLQK